MPLIDPVTMAMPQSKHTAKSSLPIELLPTPLSKLVSSAHPALLLTSLYMRFTALVSDPTETLLSGLLPLAVLQGAWCLVCLPAVGSAGGGSGGGSGKGKKGGKLGGGKRSQGEGGGWRGRVFVS